MTRLIDLQTALDLLEKDINENGEPPESDYNIGINHARCVISTIPSAQPERKKGHWIEIQAPDVDGNALYQCSVCHKGETHCPDVEVPFCWHCGADMRGEQDGGT